MNMRLFNRLWAVTALVVGTIFAAAPVFAARDKKAPTTPPNLRLTGMTAYSISLAWNPSTDNSGSVIHRICCASVSSETFPGPAATRLLRAGLEPSRTFTLRTCARNPSGNQSAPAALTTCAGTFCSCLPPAITDSIGKCAAIQKLHNLRIG